MSTQTNALEAQLKESGYKFLGIANSWVNRQTGKVEWPDRVKICFSGHKLKHDTSDIQGVDNLTICDECKIYWKYDSSD